MSAVAGERCAASRIAHEHGDHDVPDGDPQLLVSLLPSTSPRPPGARVPYSASLAATRAL